jgi:hypothetical protein
MYGHGCLCLSRCAPTSFTMSRTVVQHTQLCGDTGVVVQLLQHRQTTHVTVCRLTRLSCAAFSSSCAALGFPAFFSCVGHHGTLLFVLSLYSCAVCGVLVVHHLGLFLCTPCYVHLCSSVCLCMPVYDTSVSVFLLALLKIGNEATPALLPLYLLSCSLVA